MAGHPNSPQRAPSPGRAAAIALAAIVVSGACGGGGGGGSTSSPVPPPSASALDFTIIPAFAGATRVEFRWSGSGASSYRVEVGSTSGGSEVAVLASNGGATSLWWEQVPRGTFYARVRGLQGGTVGLPSNEVIVGSVDARLVVDALVFAYGPLAVATTPGRNINSSVRERMLGWQPGTGFGVILGESVPAAFAPAVEKTVQQIGAATLGQVGAGLVGRRPDPLPVPRPGEVTMSMLDQGALRTECACESCVGCARTYYQGALAQRSQIYLSQSVDVTTVAHELGHVIGLAHIISAAGVRPPFTMGVTTDGRFSPNGRPAELDPATVQMLRTLYGAGLTAGASRREFEAAGFVLPEGVGDASLAAAHLGARDVTVSQVGLDTVVSKALCQ